VLETHIYPRIGSKRAILLTRQDIARLHSDIAEKSQAKRKDTAKARASQHTTRGGKYVANQALRILSSIFDWAAATGFVPEDHRNPATRIEKFEEIGRERFLTTEELGRLGAAIHESETVGIEWDVDETKPNSKHIPKFRRTKITQHVAGALRLLVFTGMRLREVLNLEWRFYDRERGLLLLPDSKTGKKAIVFSAPAIEILESLPHLGRYVIASEKEGVVGDFCRAYTIFDVMEEFLPGAYILGDANSGHPRYTYTGSTSSNGAIVYDDGKFIFSHHGHDPGCEMNLNAFDFARIHKFGQLDEGEKTGKKITDLPSFKAMAEFAGEQPAVRKARVARNYDMSAMFEDAGIEALPAPDDYEYDPIADLVGDGPKPKASKASEIAKAGNDEDDAETLAMLRDLVGDDAELPPLITRLRHEPRVLPDPDPDWLADNVQMTPKGEIISNLPNCGVIVFNDPRLRGVAAFNQFTGQLVCTRSLSTTIKAVPKIECTDPYNGSRWQDFHDIAFRAILETPSGKGKAGYGMKVTDRDLSGGIVLAAHRNKFHPIQDYLRACKAGPWENVETLLIRYLGVEDNAYHREVASNIMLASVSRIFHPGCKFDFAPIIGGKQGIGKSSFIKVLYGEQWFGEIACKLDDKQEIAEEIAGKWGCELPELSAFHKSDHNAAKMFLRRTRDDVRMAYDRRVSEFLRQSVFWGTTNDLKVLKDPTGNRSYWMIIFTMEKFFDLHGLAQEREALWGATLAEYERRTGGDHTIELDLSLQNKEAKQIAVDLQEASRTEEIFEQMRDRIEMWLEEPLPLKEFMAELGKPMSDFPDDDDDDSLGDQLVLRCAFRMRDVTAALDLPTAITNPQVGQNIQKALADLAGWSNKTERRYIQKVRDRWRLRADITQDELICGYRLYETPEELDAEAA